MIKVIIDTLGSEDQKQPETEEGGNLLKGKETKGKVVKLIEQAQEVLKKSSQDSSTDASNYLDMAVSTLSDKGTNDSDNDSDRD